VATLWDDSQLQKCIDKIKASPRHIVKRILRDAAELIDDNTYHGHVDKLVRESAHKLGDYTMLRCIRSLPDSPGRNRIILRFQHYCALSHLEQMFGIWLRRLLASILRSKHVTTGNIKRVVEYYPGLTRQAARLAMQFAAEDKPKAAILLLHLANSKSLKLKERIKLAEAILGLESAGYIELTALFRSWPESRYKAASILFTRFPEEMEPSELKFMCEQKEIKELADILLPKNGDNQ
jgi:hypothetical protein